jgi:LysW-gamma-L-lysine carboxypeptidase
MSIDSEHDGRVATGRLHLDVRLPPALGPDEALAWLESTVPDGQWSLVAPGIPAWAGPRTTPLHNAFARAIRAVGGRPRHKLKTGTADLNLLAPAWGCPALAYGPGDAALDHTPHEHQLVGEYLMSVRVLEGVLATLAAVGRSGPLGVGAA